MGKGLRTEKGGAEDTRAGRREMGAAGVERGKGQAEGKGAGAGSRAGG